MINMVVKNILKKENKQESLCKRISIIGFPSSRGPYFMYFTVKNVSMRLKMIRSMVDNNGVFFIAIF